MMKILQVNCIIFKTNRIHGKTCIVSKMQKCKFRTNAIAYCSCITKGKFHSFVRYFFFLLDFCNFIHFICPIRCLFISFHSVCILCYHFLEISVEIMFYYSFHIAIVCSIHLMSNSLNSIPFDIIAAVVAIQRHIYIKCSSTRLSLSISFFTSNILSIVFILALCCFLCINKCSQLSNPRHLSDI